MEDKLLVDKDTSLENPTPEEVFVPSANQEKWLDTAIQLESSEIKAISEACGIDRTVWYDWLKVPGFIEWHNAEWEKRLQGHSWKLDVYGFNQAKRDTKALELMMKRTGKIKEVGNKGVLIQQNFTEHARNELKEFE